MQRKPGVLTIGDHPHNEHSCGFAEFCRPDYYLHADHLDTPRVVVDRDNRLRWRWMVEPFGVWTPENNPAGLGAFTLNLRSPGQYFDSERGLHYNYFRDYDSSIGRYVESDPIGLDGGINTYAYVGGNPLSYVDPQGLLRVCSVLTGVCWDTSPPPFNPDNPYPPRPTPKRPYWPPPPPDDRSSGGEAWPKDDKGFCIRTYANCINHDWTGSCEACLNRCTGSGTGDWPFDMCKPKNKWCP